MEMFTVGELSKKTGITVATLHHYDKEGLLIPKRTASGRRIYFNKDILKLEQINLLKLMGFSLKEIKEHLLPIEDTDQIIVLMEKQLQSIDEQMQALQKNREMITYLLKRIGDNGDFEWQRSLLFGRQMSMYSMKSWLTHFYNEEQLQLIEEELGGREQLLLAMSTWREMLGNLLDFMIDNTSVTDESVQALTKEFLARLKPFLQVEEFIQVLRTPLSELSVQLEMEPMPLHSRALTGYFEECIKTYLSNNKTEY